MSRDAATALVGRYLTEVWGKGDEEAARELIAEDYVDHHPPPGATPNRDGLLQAIRVVGAAFADIEVIVEDVLVDGDRVADRWTLRAVHRGAFFGLAPTGRRVTLVGMDFHRLADGRIVETWHLEDIMGLLRQRGEDTGGVGLEADHRP
jgi:steroid delta-isomerase-like uncharacterized protein